MHGSHHVGQAPLPLHLLFDNLHQQPGYHTYPNLNLYGVLIVSKEVFQWEVLLQAFEQRLYLPTSAVHLTQDACRSLEVIGKKGYSALRHPFARAIFMLFIISEVHPFADGNGRISRIMMNAEMTAAGQAKIIIPTVFRTDYLGALRQLTRKDNPENLINAIQRVRLFSYNLRGDNFEAMRSYMEHCNAFREEDEYILKF
ncbi:MAG: Fic family protein [Prevotella sp.]|jgi:hypothetical protein|nr:Fic family protein [Prevotella sp.]